MKELGFVFTALRYNNLMNLYNKIGQHERVPLVIAEMKSNGIVPDYFSYNICINAYGTRADFSGLENTLKEMECAPRVVVRWYTYAVVASQYIKGGDLREKEYSALQKVEAKMDKKDSGAYRHLISLYGLVGDKSEVKRLWALQMLNCKRYINKGYINMLAVLVKLDEITEAEDLLKEWESSKNAFDFSVPNILLKGYCQKGLLDKAEELLDGILTKGKKSSATSWAIVASGYTKKGDVARAYELTKNALSMCAPNSGWIPSPSMIEMILKYLGDEGEVKDVEAFIDLLKVVPMNSDMTEVLSRARLREEKKAEDSIG
jgi:pentatricopeptide repeat protein